MIQLMANPADDGVRGWHVSILPLIAMNANS
jgi:hypothetical protein